MAAVGDILYLKSGSQPMTVVQSEQGDSQMVTLMMTPGVMIEIPLAALTSDDPVPKIYVDRAAATATLQKAAEPAPDPTPDVPPPNG